MTVAEEVRLMTDVEWLILCGLLLILVLICAIVAAYLDHQVSKLRKENKLLRRVLEDYYWLEDGSKSAARAMTRETERSSWLPPGW